MNPNAIAEIKSRIGLQDLAREYGEFRPFGKDLLGRCLFHSEKTASLRIHDTWYKCFGCGAGGDCIAFYSAIEGVSTGRAIAVLAERGGVSLDGGQRAPTPRERTLAKRQVAFAAWWKARQIEREDTPVQPDAPVGPLYDLHELAQSFYRSRLDGRSAQYLIDRGVSAAMTIGFDLGYSAPGFPAHAIRYGFTEKQLFSAGFLSKGGETFVDRIMIPIKEPSGRCMAFGGRSLREGVPKYINSPTTAIYKKNEVLYNLSRHAATVLMEGYFDVMGACSVGVKAVASCGTALTEAQVSSLYPITEKSKTLLGISGPRLTKMALESATEQDWREWEYSKSKHAEQDSQVEKVLLSNRDCNAKDPFDVYRKNRDLLRKCVDQAVPITGQGGAVIWFDADAAGEKATRRAVAMFRALNAPCSIANLTVLLASQATDLVAA